MRLPPESFWRLSLAEWRAMVAGSAAPRRPALARADLETLMQLYPD